MAHSHQPEPEEPAPLQWEMGDILKSNYTGDHFIPYDIIIKDYKPFGDGTSSKTQFIKLHNIETGQASEMILTHVNSISFHNVSRGETGMDCLQAIKMGIRFQLKEASQNGTLGSYRYLKEDVVGPHNITVDKINSILKDP